MKLKLTPVPPLCAEDLSDREALLLQLLSESEEYIQQLIDENARLKGEKGKPKIKPSRLEPDSKVPPEEENDSDKASELKKPKKKRPGSEKRHKTASWTIDETKIIEQASTNSCRGKIKRLSRLHSSRANSSSPNTARIRIRDFRCGKALELRSSEQGEGFSAFSPAPSSGVPCSLNRRFGLSLAVLLQAHNIRYRLAI